MPLFTSSSDTSAGRGISTLQKATIGLLAIAICLIVGLELGAYHFVYRVSRNLSRIHNEALGAAQIRGGAEGREEVLLVGNSLLLHDVDVKKLEQRLLPNQHVQQFAIQATTYYDWYYALRGLLADGARPDRVVVCLEARHIVLSSVRNEIFAYYLMKRRDLFDVRRSLHLTGTETFDLLVANVSIFYALRKELRQVLLQYVLPELPQLTAMIALAPKPQPDPVALRTLGAARLTALRSLMMNSQTELDLVLMPPTEPKSSEILRQVSEHVGLRMLVPLSENELTDTDYQPDGYHLNQHGQDKFTEALIPLLLRDKPSTLLTEKSS
ncbi:MAG: hypothetical protein GDA68_02250 [Nitrospira sp. CR2.1]|nr:hypothetical protein [Nitrospira sp. CR2.1]